MQKLSALTVAVLLLGAQAWAACGPECGNPCQPVCKPRVKWIKVAKTVMEKVPVRRWVEEEVEYPCIESEMVPKQVQVTVMRPVSEEVASTTNKQIWEEEQYDSYEYRTVVVERQGTKKVCRTESVCVPKKVKRRAMDEVCEPTTGRMIRVPRIYYETVETRENRKVIEEVPVTFTEKIKEKVPVVKTRKVAKWIEVPCTKTATRMVPMLETQTKMEVVEKRVMRKKTIRKCITEYVEKPRCVVKRVCVPLDDCGNPIMPAAPSAAAATDDAAPAPAEAIEPAA